MVNQQAVLYVRQLPGGGYVSIEGGLAGQPPPYRASLYVERRGLADRRDGHNPPAVLEATGPDRRTVLDDLIGIATSNVAVAAALRRWQVEQRKAATGPPSDGTRALS